MEMISHVEDRWKGKGRSTVWRVQGLNVNFNAFKGPCFFTQEISATPALAAATEVGNFSG